MTESSIVNNCMIVNLQIGIWTGHRLDREASFRLTQESHADSDAARVNKHLIPKTALQPIVSAASSVRHHFYMKTLPWKDNGDRLLTRALYTDFMSEHNKLAEGFKIEVDKFVELAYPQAVAQAEFRMGDLFNPNDYPSQEAAARKFYIGLDIDAVTEAGDFRVDLEKSELKAVQQSMQQSMQGRLTRAMQDVWARVEERLRHFADKMGSDEAFRRSTLENLEEIANLIPALNIVNDPRLDLIGDEIKAVLVGHDPKVLRQNKEIRAEVAEEAQRIMDTMKGFMSAFGGNQ
jgi:hypothetical protein